MEDSSQPIVVEQTYPVPRERVWEALTDPAQMCQWFFKPIAEFEPRVGFSTRFTVASGGIGFVHVWKVVEAVPNERLVLDWRYEGYPGDSSVEFVLVCEGDGTYLRMTHRGQGTFPQEVPEFGRDACTKGWEFFFCESLLGFLEG